MRSRTIMMLSVFAFASAGCSDDTSSPEDGGRLDKTVLPDVAARDMSFDNVGPDGPASSDTTVDSSATDSTVDGGGGGDSTVDGATGDSTVDGATGDSTVDSTSVDSTVDTAPPRPCVQGATESVLVADAMVGCITASANVNQCAAAAACGAGWHLCTASEYQARYGAADPGLTSNLWIAGCVREGGAPFAPTDAICASCGGAEGSEVEISWWCNGITASTSALNVGLRTAGACSNVGVDDNANQAFWVTITSSQTLSGALCCK